MEQFLEEFSGNHSQVWWPAEKWCFGLNQPHSWGVFGGQLCAQMPGADFISESEAAHRISELKGYLSRQEGITCAQVSWER